MGIFGGQLQSKLSLPRLLIATCLMSLSGLNARAAGETCEYENSRYEFAIAAPCDYFDRFDSVIEADNGDGILLRSEAEGLEIRVYGSLVREALREFYNSEEIIDSHPAFGIVLVEQLLEGTETGIRAVMTPAKRNYVNIYAEARSEKKTSAELSRELAFILESMRSK